MANWSREAVEALAAAITARRMYLGRSQIDVWRNGGPANSTMTSLEGAESTTINNVTLKKLDTGLQWKPGTAIRVLREEIRPAGAAADPQFDDRKISDIDATSEENQSRRRADVEAQRRAGAEAALRDFRALIAALSVDADEIQATARSIDTAIDANDPDDVESLISEVDWLVGDIDEFAKAVDDIARKVFGGDTESLRKLKRETKRLRRLQSRERLEAIPGLEPESRSSYALAGGGERAPGTPSLGREGLEEQIRTAEAPDPPSPDDDNQDIGGGH
ncbi:hypothetical protein [Mycolicibacterium vaccae]|uniref:hypothetical protein n=1 Tax=Mycolicibacterium vaccae TaxID=1810 RepID=UPI003D065CDE